MKKLLVDTNIILDLLAKRKPFYIESGKLFSNADRKELKLVVSALSLVNAHYVLQKMVSNKEAKSIIGKFKLLVETYELNEKILELAIHNDTFNDFEDCIQYYTALESNCDFILTRNLKDYKKSEIPVMTPKEYNVSDN